MIQTLDNKIRKARKAHLCDYCNEIIRRGEEYNWSKHVFDGDFYEWRAHEKCAFLSSVMWNYADPDVVMTGEMFNESLSDLCRRFICCDCLQYNKDEDSCALYKNYCIDKAYQFFKTYELYKDYRARTYAEIWKVRERDENVE